MVYETDFYTTRRPYRASPSLSTYTISSEPSRQVRVLPGLGKVHFVHTYDRIVPYVGHKRLTVVTSPPLVVRVRPSTLYREFDRIENKLRPFTYKSYTNDYMNSESQVRIVYTRNPISSSYPVYRPSTLYTNRYYPTYASHIYSPTYLRDYYPWYSSDYYYNNPFTPTRYFHSTYNFYPSHRWYDLALYPSWRYNHFIRNFDDETRSIRAQTASLLHRIHDPVPRKVRSLPLPYVSRYEGVPARLANDNYIHRMLLSSPSSKSEYTQYYTDPIRKYFGQGHLACVTLVTEKHHPRRRNVYVYEDPVRNDIQLLSYYISHFRNQKAAQLASKVILSPIRPTRIFSVPRPVEAAAKQTEEMTQYYEDRAARMAKIKLIDDEPAKPREDKAKKEAEEAARKKAEDKAKRDAEEADAAAKRDAEEAAKRKKADAKAKKEAEAARRAAEEEAARKESEAKEAAEKAAELERLAELAKQEELAKHAAIEKAKQEEEERARLEEEKRLAEEAKAEEERQQLLRLEEIARQAEEEKEAELARQADELAELARQEAELAEQAKQLEEQAALERKAAEQAELEQQQAELEELERQERELTELAEQAKAEAETAQQEADEAALAVEEIPAEAEVVIETEVEPVVEEAPEDEEEEE